MFTIWNELPCGEFDAIVEIEFVTSESARQWAESPEYKALLETRSQAMRLTSMALKATVTLPTGREAEGLGKGRSTQSLLHITQMEFGDLSLLVNIGLTRNDNTDVVGERKSLWNTSAGAVYALDDQLSLVFEMGSRKQEALSGGKHPSFAQIGAIWHPGKDLDLDFGLKLGLNSAETDRTIGVGLTKRWGE